MALPEQSLELPGPPQRGQKRACEPYVDVPEALWSATRACNLRGIARTSHFRGTCLREVCRGSSDDDFAGPMTFPRVFCEGLLPFPNSHWSSRGLHIDIRSALVSLMSTSQRPWGSHESMYYTRDRAHIKFRGTCLREVCRGSSDDDFGGPMTLPNATREVLWFPLGLAQATCEDS